MLYGLGYGSYNGKRSGRSKDMVVGITAFRYMLYIEKQIIWCGNGGWLHMLLCFYRKKPIRVRTLLMLAPLGLTIAWDQIEYYFFSSIQDDSARYQLLFKSFEVAKDHFPLESGFGTFASYYSGVSYSPLYYTYGLSNVNGLRVNDCSFVSDSFWPMILGQTGWFGCIAYIVAIAMLFMEIHKLRKISSDYYVVSLCGLSYILISSTAESAFVHPLTLPIAIIMGCLLQRNEENVKTFLMWKRRHDSTA